MTRFRESISKITAKARTGATKVRLGVETTSTVVELGGFALLTTAAGVTFGEGAALASGGASLLLIGYGLSK